jgi:hypothetical protein
MAGMKKRIIIALVAALPTELVNFFVSPFPIDVGLPPDAGPFAQFMGTQWLILHYPGLLFSSRIDHFEHSGLMISTLLVSGYIDSALLIFLGIYLYRAIRRLVRRNSAASA